MVRVKGLALLALAVCTSSVRPADDKASGFSPFPPPAAVEDDKALRQYLRSLSWTVLAVNEEGNWYSAGSCTVTTDKNGVSWALGCWHVIRKSKVGEGDKARYVGIRIARPLFEDGQRIGDVLLDVDVVKASEEHDLCLMKVRKKAVGPQATFALDRKHVAVDETLYHCGSFLKDYQQSISVGFVEGHGYRKDQASLPCDHANMTLYPGSSGGGVFTKDGVLVGVMIWGHGPTNAFYVPADRILDWLNDGGYGKGGPSWPRPIRCGPAPPPTASSATCGTWSPSPTRACPRTPWPP